MTETVVLLADKDGEADGRSDGAALRRGPGDRRAFCSLEREEREEEEGGCFCLNRLEEEGDED